jgi:hypothetical protein
MQKDFITATPDSGGSGSTTVTATAPANQTESARSTSLSVAGGGMTYCWRKSGCGSSNLELLLLRDTDIAQFRRWW